jgi:hypothetical protein
MIRAIKRFLKKDHNIRNIYHPDISDKVKYSFTCKGIKYYTFTEDHKMLAGRYFIASRVFRELSLAITTEVLGEYLDLIIKDANKGDLVKVAVKLNELKSRNNIAIEEETLYRLASIVYFHDMESLDSYDQFINSEKIEDWRDAKQYDFFFTKPISDYIDLDRFSPEDFPHYLNQMKGQSEKLKKLMHEL